MKKTVDLVNVFVAVAAAVFLMVSAFNGGASFRFLAGYYFGGFQCFLGFSFGLIVFVWNLYCAVKDFRGGVYKRSISVTTEEGSGSVNVHAMENQLLAVLGRAGDVSAAALELDARREGQPVLCRMAFKLARQDNIMRRVDELKKQVREEFQRIIPDAGGIEISANVVDLVDGAGAAVTVRAEAARFEDEEFSGPKYPAHDGEDA